jgi:PTH1 family peptidyl-tRNA hydrolase
LTTPIQLIVGLGNPGDKYENTRHNAGAWFVEQLLESFKTTLTFEKKFHGMHGVLSIHEHKCHLLIPTTFMNLSGQAVAAIANFYKIMPPAILVAHDELDLPVGVCRLKEGGGHAGHNGLRDIIAKLGSSDFIRLRIGIGHPGKSDLVHDYVLNAPNKAEQLQITDSIATVMPVVPEIIAGDLAQAMNFLHTSRD